MALAISNIFTKTSLRSLEDKLSLLTISCSSISVRYRQTPLRPGIPRLRNPTWFTQKHRNPTEETVTADNTAFIKEVIQHRFVDPSASAKELITVGEYKPKLQRSGVIARKIGVYPLWLKNGKKISTTLLQVLDNHVIKYYTPESYEPPRKRIEKIINRKGCLLLGAEAVDPTTLTKEYCGLFKDSGVIPKKILYRFFVSPEAALPPGALLNAQHFQVGNFIDVRGLTIDRGFQGVMKRHGFKGMPASHGHTKTHRRGGNIGGGGEKARVWPGTKMPGHMGNRWRTLRGLKVWRINTKYNVLYVSGHNIPGLTNSIVYIYDTKLPERQPTKPLPVPTLLDSEADNLLEDIYDESVHGFGEPSIVFNE